MIPPLEDEIDEEEEEMMAEGMAPIEDNKSQSPAGQGIPPVEEDLAPLEEATAPVEEEKSETAEMGMDTGEEETDKKVAASEGGVSPAEDVKQDEKTPGKEVKSSPACLSETKDGVTPSSPKEENPLLPSNKTADPSESKEEESASADTAKKKEEG